MAEALVLPIRAAAARLSVSHKTISRLIERGELRGLKIRWRWYVSLTELDRFVRAGQAAQMKKLAAGARPR